MSVKNHNGSNELEIFLSNQDPTRHLCGKFVARHLGISMQTLYRRCKKGLIDYIKVDRNVRFEVQAVLKYIADNRVSAQ